MNRWTFLSVLVLAFVLVGSREKPTTIYKWDALYRSTWETEKVYQFVISNPPKGQRALLELVKDYLEKSPPPGFESGEYGAAFYRESNVTPTDENLRPESNWWDQSWDVPYIKFKSIDEQLIAGAGYRKNKILRISLYGEYDRTCKANDFAIVDIQPDGSRDPTCD